MTFRVTPQNSLDVIRSLVDEVELIKRQVGTTKQNTIRLSNWVLEAIDDSLVKMTNLVTGEESFIGGVGDGGGDVVTNVTFEFPPFVVAGVIRGAFGTSIKTNVYTVPYDVTSLRIISTIASLSPNPGDTISFSIVQNGVVVFTSPAQSTNKEVYDFVNTFAADDEVYMTVDATNSSHIGLTVMIRSV